jgi:hypothetical protein
MSELRVLHEDAYSVVRLEPKLRLVTFVRTSARIPDLEAGKRTFGALRTLATGDADRLLSDLRDAPGNNSPEWEALFDEMGRRFFFERFKKRVALVRTIAGKLQVERIARETGSSESFRAFQDEAEARRWLLE